MGEQKHFFKQSINLFKNILFIIYRFHANIERQLKLSGYIGKKSTLLKHEDIILNSLTQTREK